MGSDDERGPPALPGEVWRAEQLDEGWQAVAPDPEGESVGLVPWVWRPHFPELPTLGRWRERVNQKAADGLRAWALAERARSEKAEAIAAAERALRVAADRYCDDPRDFGPYTITLRKSVEDARDALLALGVEP